MNHGGVSLDAYAQQGDGFGSASQNDVLELNKALEAGQEKGGAVDGRTDASGAPLKVESLEKTLKVVTFSEKNIVMWKDTPVLPAYNTVEEYNRLIDYGSDQGGFNSEGETPQEDDSTYQRNSELVKFLGTTRVVSHPMTLVTPAHGSVIEREVKNGTLWILQKMERALFEGNSAVIPQEFNGLYKQAQLDFGSEIDYYNSEHTIDLRGKAVTEETLETASNTILENYGYATDIYWSPKAGSDYAKQFYPRQRSMTPIQEGGKTGSNVTSFVSQAGEISFKPDVFLRAKIAKTSTTLATSSKAPAAPVADATTPVGIVTPTVTGSKYGSTDNGNYLYAVSALNSKGESSLTVLDTDVAAIAAGGAADLKFTAGSGIYAATGYKIYRALKNATYQAGVTKFFPLFEISTAQLASGYNGGGVGIVRELNIFLPGTTGGIMLQRDLEVFSFKQLAPLMRMDLALTSPAYRFMVLLYGTPIVYAPKKMVRFINIGSEVDAAHNALIA